MKILLTGAGTRNKGAHLMLITVAEYLKKTFPNAILVLSPNTNETEDLEKFNFQYLKFPLFLFVTSERLFNISIHYPVITKFLLKFFYKSSYPKGLIKLKDISLIIDISGFAFGDKWGKSALINLNVLGTYAKHRNIPMVLMPQAFGPFSGNLNDLAKNAFDNMSYIFARDSISYSHLLATGSKAPSEKVPDITLQLKPKQVKQRIIPSKYIVIVPNERLLDKGSDSWRKNYMNYLLDAARHILANSEFNVCLLAHCQKNSQDFQLVNKLYTSLSANPRVSKHHHENPLVLKSWLASAEFVIASRFHALASSLSSNVPSVATSWNHKYEELFTDYGCKSYSHAEATPAFLKSVDMLIDDDNRAEVKTLLLKSNKKIAKDSKQVWETINKISEQL